MAIAYGTSSTNSLSGSGTDITFDKPTGLVEGEVIVAVVRSAAAPIISPPDGSWGEFAQSAVTNRTIAMFYKVAGASEPATYTFTYEFSVDFRGGGLSRFSGVDTTTPSDCTAAVRSGTFTEHIYSSITTATNGAMLVGCVTSNNTSFDPVPPAELTERWQITRTAFSSGIKASAGATGDLTGTQGGTSFNYNTILAALRPASAGGGLSLPVASASYRRRRAA